ncbi:MAG: ATP-binding cassette domain-containing protein, partial [Thiogranum sp.]
MSSDVIIDIQNVTKWFGELTALYRVSMQVRVGEVVVIVGPSGAGKSTLLRCINRLEAVDEGMIIVDDIPLDSNKHINQVRAEVGMVFQ